MRRTWTGLYVPDRYAEAPEPNLLPLTAQEFQIVEDGLSFFETHPEIRCIWEFNLNAGPLAGLAFEPGASRIPASDYWIVCPFLPGRLIVHSPQALRAGGFNVSISHGVLFDANLYDRIVRFVDARDSLSSAEVKGVQTLLEAIIARGYDYQLMPYVLESFAKNRARGAYEYACRATKAILRLHMMHKEQFRATGVVRADPEALDDYESRFGTVDLDRIVEAQLEPYRGRLGETPTTVTLTLLALLKMVLIRRSVMPHRDLDAQWAAFDEFLFGRLGIYAGAIRTIALLYFSGRLDRWIPTQRNSNADSALAVLTNCAWDLFLGSLPRQILAESSECEPLLYHFCTRERALASVLASSLIYMLKVMRDDRFVTYFSTNEDLFHAAIGEGSAKSIKRANERVRGFLENRDAGTSVPIAAEQVRPLLADVIDEFRSSIGRQ